MQFGVQMGYVRQKNGVAICGPMVWLEYNWGTFRYKKSYQPKKTNSLSICLFFHYDDCYTMAEIKIVIYCIYASIT